MKSLRPNTNASAGLIAEDVAYELRAQLEVLQKANEALGDQIKQINQRLDKGTISKELVSADAINAAKGNVGELTSELVKAEGVEAESMASKSATIGVLHSNEQFASTMTADDGSFNSLDATDAAIERLRVDEADAGQIHAETVNAQDALIESATVSELTVQNRTTLNGIDTDEAVIGKAEIDEAEIGKADINEAIVKSAESLLAKIDKLVARNTVMTDDPADAESFVILEQDSGNPDETDDHKYIRIPAVKAGFARIDVQRSDNSWFAVTVINTETAPILHYSKYSSGDIDGVWYDRNTGDWYIKTYASGRIYFSNNDAMGNTAPETYSEPPIDLTKKSLFYYECVAQSRLVIMGDHGLDYGLVVQGVLEADLIKENDAYHQLFFWGDNVGDLTNFCETYLKYVDEEGRVLSNDSELTGYIYHNTEDGGTPGSGQNIDKLKEEYEEAQVRLETTQKEMDERETEWETAKETSETKEEALGDDNPALEYDLTQTDYDIIRVAAAAPQWPGIVLKKGDKNTVGPDIGSMSLTNNGVEFRTVSLKLTMRENDGGWMDPVNETYTYDKAEALGIISGINEEEDTITTGTDSKVSEYVDAKVEEETAYEKLENARDEYDDAETAYKSAKAAYEAAGGNSLRDYDNRAFEALEKIRYDGNEIVLTVDAGYGQDELIIPASDNDETLPFVVSFMLGSYKWDTAMNDGMKNNQGLKR